MTIVKTIGNPVPGQTSGAAIGAGLVGETIEVSSTTLLTTSAANIVSQTLQPGKWRLDAILWSDSGGTMSGGKLSISSTSGTHNAATEVRFPRNTTSGYSSASTVAIVNISSASTYYVVANSVTANADSFGNTRLICTRIA